MPIDGTSRGLSALSGFGLLLTAFVLCYLNATTTTFLWSTVYVAGVVVASLACAAKFAMALGADNRLAQAFDSVAGIVPWVAVYFNGIQALHFKHDGLDGMMAGVAIIALVFIIGFGVTDSLQAWFGAKYKRFVELAERAERAGKIFAEGTRG